MITLQLHKYTALIFALIILILAQSAQAEILYVVNSQSRTLSRIDTSTDEVNNSFATLGNVPNKIVVGSEYIWAVNSGDNAVQKIAVNSGATLSNILIGIGSNPWDAVLHQDYLYVTGLFTGKVYKVDTLSGSVVGNVTVGTAPEALLVIGDKLYVSNAGNYSQNYAGSSVSVIDLPSFTVLTTIPVSANPQYLASHNGMLHVSCTGNWADVGGSVCIIDPATDTLVHTINVGGTPGCIWIANSSLALVADANGTNLFSYDPETYQLLHGIGDPIPNGGSEIVGNSSLIAVLAPNWSGNGTLRLHYPDLTPWKQYAVALMPTDLKLAASTTANDDQMLPHPLVSVYPNPSRQGTKLDFSSSLPRNSSLQVFNARGQQVAILDFAGKSTVSLDLSLPSGIYFYRVNHAEARNRTSTGKFIILR